MSIYRDTDGNMVGRIDGIHLRDIYGNWAGDIRGSRLYDTGEILSGSFEAIIYMTQMETGKVKCAAIDSTIYMGTGSIQWSKERNDRNGKL